MTTITEQIEGDKISIHMRGHAGYRKENDIVCAAESILMRTLLDSMDGVKCEANEEEAEVKMEAPLTPGNILIWNAIRNGYELLQEEYPQNVKMARLRGEKEKNM